MLSQQDHEVVGQWLAQNYGINVVCDASSARTDGRTIHLPPVPPLSEESDGLAMMRFYLDHEASHILGESDMGALGTMFGKHGKVGQHILNGLEDVRVEALIGSRHPGCRFNLDRGYKLVDDEQREKFHSTHTNENEFRQLSHPDWQIGVAVYALGRGSGIPDWFGDHVKDVTRRADEQFGLRGLSKWATSTEDLVPCAEWVTKEYLKAAEQPQAEDSPPEPSPKSGDGDSGDESGGSAGETVPSDGQQDADSGSEGTPEGATGEDPSYSDGESNPDDGPIRPQAPGTADFDLSDISRSVGEQMREAFDKASGELQDKLGSFPTRDNNGSVDFRDREAELHDCVGEGLPRRHINGVSQRQHKNWLKDVERTAAVARQRLQLLLASEHRQGWMAGQRRGMPDPRHIADLAAGTRKDVLRVRHEEEAPTTAAALIVDGSNSMSFHKKIRRATIAAGVFVQALESAGHQSFVMKFVSRHADREHPTVDGVGVRTMGVRYTITKDWGESFRSASRRMCGQYCPGGTPIGESIVVATRAVLSREANRRLVLVFSDGESGTYWDVRAFCKHIERSYGVQIGFIGIGTNAVRDLHHRYIIVNKIEDLAGATIAQLRGMLGL